MKYIFIIIFLIFFNINYVNAEDQCEGLMAKLKAKCNIVGKSMDKMREFSKENKTIGQSLGISDEGEKKKTLREFSKENRTIDQTYRNIKEKLKKKK